MKLASYQDGSRDGQLLVVSHDLQSATFATEVATRMQAVLDDWNFISPQLEEIYRELNQGKRRHRFDFEPQRCLPPLPRPHLMLQGVAPAPQAVVEGPQPSAATLGGAHTAIELGGEPQPVVGQPQWVAITGDLAWGASRETCLGAVRLLALAQAVGCEGSSAGKATNRLGFSPVAITPEELSPHWPKGVQALQVRMLARGQDWGRWATPASVHTGMGALLEQAARQRPMGAGTVLCMPLPPEPDAPPPKALLLEDEDTVALDVKKADGTTLFGALNQPLRWQTPP